MSSKNLVFLFRSIFVSLDTIEYCSHVWERCSRVYTYSAELFTETCYSSDCSIGSNQSLANLVPLAIPGSPTLSFERKHPFSLTTFTWSNANLQSLLGGDSATVFVCCLLSTPKKRSMSLWCSETLLCILFFFIINDSFSFLRIYRCS